MGSPIAPLLANACMNWILDQASSLLDQNIALIRYVDDILCVTFNQTVFDNIFRILPGIHSSIQFSQQIKEHFNCLFLIYLRQRIMAILCKHQFKEKEHTPVYIQN